MNLFLAIFVIMEIFASTPVHAGDKSPAQWVSSQDSFEEYERLVQESDGKILIELMHARGTTNPWGVFKNGAGMGDYVTREQAKVAAEKLLGYR